MKPTIEEEFRRRDSAGASRKWYRCLCSCGVSFEVRKNKYDRGQSSCGCKRYGGKKGRIYNRELNDNPVLYSRWRAMLQRAKSVTGSYRSIGVCPSWKEYTVFREWALGNGYEPSKDLDRIDNTRGYSAENCQYLSQADHVAKTNKDRSTPSNLQ